MLFEKIDNGLLTKFEKFSHKWQKLTGKNCFWLAKLSAVCGAIFGTLFIGLGILIQPKTGIIGFPLIFFLFFGTILSVKIIRLTETMVELMNLLGLSNPTKITMKNQRVLSVFFFVFFFSLVASVGLSNPVFFLMAFYAVSEVAEVYFTACDPLPPAKSKIRQWLESLVSAAKKAVSISPAPVPAPQQ